MPTFRSGAPAEGQPGQGQSGQGQSGQGPGGSGRPQGGEAAPAVPSVPVTPAATPVSGGPAEGGPAKAPAAAFQAPVVIFQPPEITGTRPQAETERPAAAVQPGAASGADAEDQGGTAGSRRRRRGGRGRGKSGAEGAAQADSERSGADGEQGGQAAAQPEAASHGPEQDGAESAEEAGGTSTSSRRRRRRRQRGGSGAGAEAPSGDEPADTVVHVREPRSAEPSDDVRSIKGSTRLEAKRQRRREGRETGRRRPPIISESEFLARREAVERVMVVRQHDDRTQIAVLEDGVLVEHYVDRASHQSYVGNVYLGKVQNVLPSMEAAFVDVGKGRNAVLYAGEVNFDASGLEGVAKRIESALKSGQSVMVQVTKDPIGHKGARLTSQISLPGRYLVYVPGASMTGISRKLPDTERSRLKQILKKVAPEDGGIIVRTAAEGASEEELEHDVTRLVAQWQAIERKAKTASAPDLLYSEPDLTIRVVRDIFNEDFTKLVIASDSEWDLVDEYVRYVAPTLADRLERWSGEQDPFDAYRINEQLAKALDRKVWLPSGGSLVIDTTEAMTVIDVNTGKFTGQGGNLEQTVTRNNLEAAEEIVRQLRLRDIGGIIVIDFIDMVLESNRDLVLRRLIECLARDRTKHQVAEVTSLGLVQMTRKRVGSGLLAAFSVPCEVCNGRGVLVSVDLDELPHQHGRGGAHPAPAKQSPAARSKSARTTKAIAQVAAKTIETPAAEVTGSGAAESGAAGDGASAPDGGARSAAREGTGIESTGTDGAGREGSGRTSGTRAASTSRRRTAAERRAAVGEQAAADQAAAGGAATGGAAASEAAGPAAEAGAEATDAGAPAVGKQAATVAAADGGAGLNGDAASGTGPQETTANGSRTRGTRGSRGGAGSGAAAARRAESGAGSATAAVEAAGDRAATALSEPATVAGTASVSGPGTATTVVTGETAPASAQRRRRSAHREAGPPDPALAAAAATGDNAPGGTEPAATPDGESETS